MKMEPKKTYMILHILTLAVIRTTGTMHLKSLSEPGFVRETLKNVTVPEGRDVLLSCTVKNLDGHKVAWIHYDKSAILTVQNHVITRNPRIGVSHEGSRTWNLHIRDVQQADQGAYMCQINTAKAKTRIGHLNVVVPPRIEDSMSSGDKVRTEGSNVTLECSAHGSPKPTVTWKREDRLDITIDRSKNITVPNVRGHTLHLYKVSRLDMGAYMCIASNGVPPAVSKRIQLGIDFPPMMWVPQQQISAYRGSKGVTLECVVEAHPEALTFWEKGGRMLQSGNRFHMNNLRQTPSYKIKMMLQIGEVQKEDFGTYKCIAKNPRGQTDGQITLTEEIPLTTSTKTTPSTTTSLERVEIDIIQKKNGYHSKSKGHSYSKDVNEFDDGEDHHKRKNRRRKNGRSKKRNKDNRKSKSDYESDQYHGIQDSVSSSPAFSLSNLSILHINIYQLLSYIIILKMLYK